MYRIDSQGAVNAPPAPGPVGSTVGYFTEGDPVNSIPATVVSADWLNSVQEELISLLTATGITPDKKNRTQVLASIISLIENRASTPNALILNNQTVAIDLGGAGDFEFDGSVHRQVIIDFNIYRKDAGTEICSAGKLVLTFKPVANAWEIIPYFDGPDDVGVTFSLDQSAGVAQVQYQTTDLSAGSYLGEMRAKISRFAA